jgi:hypothetical protein
VLLGSAGHTPIREEEPAFVAAAVEYDMQCPWATAWLEVNGTIVELVRWPGSDARDFIDVPEDMGEWLNERFRRYVGYAVLTQATQTPPRPTQYLDSTRSCSSRSTAHGCQAEPHVAKKAASASPGHRHA